MATARSWWPTSRSFAIAWFRTTRRPTRPKRRRWLDLARVFGLHLTRLDIRQDARRYQEVLTEIFRAIGAADDFAALDEAGSGPGC